METLKLNETTLTEEEHKLETARIAGMHDGIKRVIIEIEKVEQIFINHGAKVHHEFITLKNNLGELVYKNWPNKGE